MMNAEIINCLIIDDEPVAHYVLCDYIEKHPRLRLAGQCYNAVEALNYLRQNAIDLMFLDIDMPEINGLEFLQLLTNPPKTILTTAYSEYALESYEYGVLDYLLKPISSTRFIKAVERFLALDSNNEVPESPYFKTKIDGRNVEIEFDNIEYIQSYGNFVKIHSRTKVYLVAMTTQEITTHLPSSQFMRIHKSYIVSLYKIDKSDGNYVVVAGKIIPIGITFKRELQEKLATIL